ncbi:hypothetical protein H4R33_006364, partial [Dimargaris cristalligena]
MPRTPAPHPDDAAGSTSHILQQVQRTRRSRLAQAAAATAHSPGSPPLPPTAPTDPGGSGGPDTFTSILLSDPASPVAATAYQADTASSAGLGSWVSVASSGVLSLNASDMESELDSEGGHLTPRARTKLQRRRRAAMSSLPPLQLPLAPPQQLSPPTRISQSTGAKGPHPSLAQ